MNTKRSYLTLLGGVGALALFLIIGITLAITGWLRDEPEPATHAAAADGPSNPGESSEARRDRIAAAPMLAVSDEEAKTGTPALGEIPTMAMPAATTTGPAGIPTGYPKTGEGAAAQLGEILVSVFQSMDLTHAQHVEQEWAQPDRGDQPWSVLVHVQNFLRGGKLTNGLPAQASMKAIPVAAQIKGSDGNGWHVACALIELTYSYRETATIAYGHCERMTWDDAQQRWVIASGQPAAKAPSTWAGSERAIEAGWKTWKVG